MYGLIRADFQKDLDAAAVQVWPENLPTVNLFIAMSTQWRIGGVGPTGLDYGPLAAVMELVEIEAKDRPDAFDGLRIMESEALKIMGEHRG